MHSFFYRTCKLMVVCAALISTAACTTAPDHTVWRTGSAVDRSTVGVMGPSGPIGP